MVYIMHRVIVPSHNEDGILNYFVGRSYMESGMKYRIQMYLKMWLDLIIT